MFTGAFTALVTPFTNGQIAENQYYDFVKWQIDSGISGLVPCGTTGESPTLSHTEHNKIIEICIDAAKNTKAKVIAGTGSNSTKEAIAMTQHAEQAGADAALVVSPYYNKPTQAGLYQHFKTISDNSNLPIIIYNIPGRSVIDVKDDTILKLLELPNIAGIKDATGDLTRPLNIHNNSPKKISQLSGEDTTAMAFNLSGGCGVISVTANIMPAKLSEQQNAWLAGDYNKAMKINFELAQLHEAMFIETSPAPVKYALSLMGKISAEVRLPLAEVTAENKEVIKRILAKYNLI